MTSTPSPVDLTNSPRHSPQCCVKTSKQRVTSSRAASSPAAVSRLYCARSANRMAFRTGESALDILGRRVRLHYSLSPSQCGRKLHEMARTVNPPAVELFEVVSLPVGDAPLSLAVALP